MLSAGNIKKIDDDIPYSFKYSSLTLIYNYKFINLMIMICVVQCENRKGACPSLGGSEMTEKTL